MPKIIDKNKRRAEIAKKAIEILAKKGFQNTTTKDIAFAAGIGKATIYHYFKTKEEILKEVSKKILYEFERSLGASLFRVDEPVEKLSALIQKSLTVSTEMEHLFIIYIELWLIHYRSSKYGNFINMFKDLISDLKTIIVDKIDEGKKQGIFTKETNSEALAIYIVGSFDGVILHYLSGKSFDMEQVTKEFIKVILRGLKHGLTIEICENKND